MPRGKSAYTQFIGAKMRQLPKGLSKIERNDAMREFAEVWNALQRGETRSNPGGISKGKLVIGGIVAYVAYRYLSKKTATPASTTSTTSKAQTGL
ncbi:MAG: hypothetical protein M0T85_01695 [Dehalococcoidales bacterium]|nr:hypothetical protein [Dehalococcoidales bacterium]